MGADRLKNRLNRSPSRFVAARHDRRPVPCAFFAAGNAGADVINVLRRQRRRAAIGVGKQGIAAVDNNIARRQQRH